jgi:hypothetical protein
MKIKNYGCTWRLKSRIYVKTKNHESSTTYARYILTNPIYKCLASSYVTKGGWWIIIPIRTMHPYFANSTINLCSFESMNKHTHLIFAFAKLVWFYRKTIFNNLCNKITERESQNATAIFRFHSRKLTAQKNIVFILSKLHKLIVELAK